MSRISFLKYYLGLTVDRVANVYLNTGLCDSLEKGLFKKELAKAQKFNSE